MQQINFFRSVFARNFLLVFATVYLLFSVGVLKSSHFCMDRLASVTYFSSEAKKCACSIYASEKSNCCSDDHDLVRLEDDQQFNQAYHLSIPHLYILEDLYTERLIAAVSASPLVEDPAADDPAPPRPKNYVLNCSLLFYDSQFLS